MKNLYYTNLPFAGSLGLRSPVVLLDFSLVSFIEIGSC
jgi:hypothetical protein